MNEFHLFMLSTQSRTNKFHGNILTFRCKQRKSVITRE
jgi:hypothetical protein